MPRGGKNHFQEGGKSLTWGKIFLRAGQNNSPPLTKFSSTPLFQELEMLFQMIQKQALKLLVCSLMIINLNLCIYSLVEKSAFIL